MRNLLLISQDSEVVDLVTRVAGRSGVELLNPDSTEEASSVICRQPERINLVLLDLLPRFQGMILLEQIREWKEPVPVIALTQSEDRMAASLACAKGADGTLEKPLSEHEVEKILERF